MASFEYEPVLSAKAWEFLCSLPRKRQQRVIRLIQQLAEQSWRLGDYRTTDNAGRFLENIRLNGFLITYWTDGPAGELRVIDIAEL
jgi:hypothetical protein